jgi:transposase-like protein
MASKQFQNILHLVTDLNYSQLKKLWNEVEPNIDNNQVGQAIADHEEAISHCPHCDFHELNRWGMTKQGIQQFKCKSCNKTFNALADSPLYRMKKSEKWIKYTKLMWEDVS